MPESSEVEKLENPSCQPSGDSFMHKKSFPVDVEVTFTFPSFSLSAGWLLRNWVTLRSQDDKESLRWPLDKLPREIWPF